MDAAVDCYLLVEDLDAFACWWWFVFCCLMRCCVILVLHTLFWLLSCADGNSWFSMV